ncbi:hypothetical protein HELRODRAFT_177886 [Helobdella robusta]|uniref:WSC domain-containing protein n=1 Tax=Helobdella robusta TaxID=6412 RepID=T1FCF2_HELRO|nr:hypothetical protein HELRODRAFT_177886 [Helobdella robusta]ESN97465.1 hypothetical protein HELRODRAFT_177886 [Helobdella robusta]
MADDVTVKNIDVTKLCGNPRDRIYHPSISCEGQILEVTCLKGSRSISRYVIVTTSANVLPEVTSCTIPMSEVEVYGEPTLKRLQHIGCFKRFKTTSQSGVTSIADCQLNCRKQGSSVLAMKNGVECHCGERADVPVTSSKCDVICPRVEKFCGGTQYYSVYAEAINKVSLIGCFDGSGTIVGGLSFMIDVDGSFSACMLYCKVTSTTFFAILNGTRCICTSTLSENHQTPNSKCHIRCNDDASRPCGGPNVYSLYSLLGRYTYARQTTTYHFCMNNDNRNSTNNNNYNNNNNNNNNSNCLPGQCESGWMGLMCDIRDKSSDYIGCYAKILYGAVAFVKSVAECRAFCDARANSHMIALSGGKECYCVDEADQAVETSNCRLKCVNGGEMCGGDSHYALYSIKTAPNFTDVQFSGGKYAGEIVTFEGRGVLTIGMCLQACFETNHSVAYISVCVSLRWVSLCVSFHVSIGVTLRYGSRYVSRYVMGLDRCLVTLCVSFHVSLCLGIIVISITFDHARMDTDATASKNPSPPVAHHITTLPKWKIVTCVVMATINRDVAEIDCVAPNI